VDRDEKTSHHPVEPAEGEGVQEDSSVRCSLGAGRKKGNQGKQHKARGIQNPSGRLVAGWRQNKIRGRGERRRTHMAKARGENVHSKSSRRDSRT